MSEADVSYAGLSDPARSGVGGASVPLDFGRSVSLSQREGVGADYAYLITIGPRIFRPSYGPDT